MGRNSRRKEEESVFEGRKGGSGMGVGKEVSPICRCRIVKSDELKLNDSPLLRDG